MLEFEIAATKSTPLVTYSPRNSNLLIQGRSFPENAKQFYEPLIVWIQESKQYLPKQFVVTINLEYYNTSSSKFLMELFRLLARLRKELQAQISVCWQYTTHDIDMCDAGKEYMQFVDVPFELQEIALPS